MPRLTPVAPSSATGRTAELFTGIKSKLGMVPNMMQTLGHSPAALEGYLSLSSALGGGLLTATQREQIALAVGQANSCDYCLAAHSALGKMAGLTVDQIRDARLGTAVDAKDEALVGFARKLVDENGHVDDADLANLKQHGFSEGEIVEIVLNVSLNILTNYFNHVADPKIDFPAAPELAAAGTCSSNGTCSTH
ncbi:carboxymuconolactone decarboxylase family protein [Aeoliella mucimassa]|uniref:Carboxymuconolactone decarboxylase family protein n=1 Tax=Aeoliella mucimassa TaxID=2527972 RepID=A0A518AVQ2_9BACT|nr:carboxymuconolactone decarboxylase family protein [Aeoliella mucimassa]QDU58805.1 Carboxymuconolactone decarboxylase family protein [Aeoliella mucimassa]